MERTNLRAALEELALSQTGLIDAQGAQRVGKMLGAQYIITGMISEAGGKIRIDAQIIQTETGKVTAEKVVSPSTAYLPRMIELLANNIVYELTGKRSYQTELIVKAYPTRYFLVGCAISGITTLGLHLVFLNKQREYRDATQLGEFDRLYKAANNTYKLRNFMFIVTGAAIGGTIYCWIRNRSPEKIYATYNTPLFMPVVKVSSGNEYVLGFQIQF